MSTSPNLTLLHTDDMRTHGAIHESGHALAYIAIGRGFQHIDMDPDQDGHMALAMVIPHYRMIDAESKARTCMAGPVIEAFLFRRTIDPDPETARLILERLDEARDAYAEAKEWGEEDSCRDDYTDAGPLAVAALPWALALITDNWATVESMARRVLDGGQRITTHDELRPYTPEHVTFTQETIAAWTSALYTPDGQTVTP